MKTSLTNSPVQTRAERHANLHRHWGFACTCPRCSQPPHMLAESDERVRSIRSLISLLDDYTTPAPPDTSSGKETDNKGFGPGPAAAELLLQLFELEGLHGRIYEIYYRLALEWNGVGDAVRATQAARNCLDRGLLVRGPDQVFVHNMRELVADPTAHWSWRFRTKLRTKAAEEETKT